MRERFVFELVYVNVTIFSEAENGTLIKLLFSIRLII